MKNHKYNFLILIIILSSFSLFSQTLLHNFEFNGNLNDTKPTGVSLTEVNVATSSFGTSPNSWTWTQTTKPGGGLELLTNQLPDETNYSLGFRIKFNETGSGYRKIITFKGTGNDNGLYFKDDKLILFPGGNSTTSYTANTFYDFVLTRASDNTFKIYTVSGGTATLVYNITDTPEDAVPVLVGTDRQFRFFMNDNDGRNEHTTGGTVRSIRLWDRALTAQEIEGALSSAVTHDATNVINMGATLNGEVNPQGSSSTFSYEWGTTTAYGNTLSPTTPSSSSASSSVAISADLSGLISGQTYHYRIKSTNGSGDTFGADKTFTTVSPGGGADLNLWLKADAGTGAINTSWQDQSGHAHNYTTVAGPTVVTNALNYNTGVEVLSGSFTPPSGVQLGNSWSLFFISKKLASDEDGRIFDGSPGNYLWGHWGTRRNGIFLEGNPSDYNTGITTSSGIRDLHLHSYTRSTASSPAENLEAKTDGNKIAGYVSASSANGVSISIHGNTSEPSDSRVGEMIIYNRALSFTEVAKVESYLGVKYGVSLFWHYISSNGTNFWDAQLTPAYQTGIIGIGKDSQSALLQKQSHSINDDFRVYIDALAVGNTSNAGTINNDNSYLMVGNNNANLSTGSTEAPSTIDSRINREWKVTNTNFAESFSLDIKLTSAPADISRMRLLVDNDGDFSNATVASPIITLNGTTVTVTGLDVSNFPLNSTRYITLATLKIPTPGDVNSNLYLWLKADAGIVKSGANISQWTDQSSNSLSSQASKTATANVTLVEGVNGINYNPAVLFDGTSSQRFTGSYTTTPNSAPLFFVVVKSTLNGGCCQDPFALSPAGAAAISPVGSNFGLDGSGFTCSNTTNDYNELGIVRGDYNSLTNSAGGTSAFNGLNSTSAVCNGSEGTSGGISSPNGDFEVGGRTGGGLPGRIYEGLLAEVIHYNSNTSTTQDDIQKIESYLALKYGITMVTNYLRSDSYEIFNVVTYGNNIIGLANDNASGLIQKQSHSVNDTARIYLSSLATTNSANTGSFSRDLSSLIMGDNGESMTSLGSTEFPSGEGIFSRIEREWKITNTDFTETFSLDFTMNALGITMDINHIRILLDIDGDFSDAIVISPTLSLNGNVLTISGLTVSNNTTAYITIASINALTTLPVKLVSFDATLQNDVVMLAWQTASEINNDFFTVERSINGLNWEPLSKIEGAGNSSIELDYSYIDETPYNDISYYRLKQTDFDNKYSYSAVKSINIQGNTSSKVYLYPNPTQSEITMKGAESELENIRIYNVLGQDISHLCKQLILSSSEVSINLSNLISGVYFIKTTNTMNKVSKL